MPATIGYRRRILAVGLIAAGALYSFGAPLYVNRIEDDLEQRVPEELADAGFTDVTAEFDVPLMFAAIDPSYEGRR